jgi:Flp pilus assembly pilin Flp
MKSIRNHPSFLQTRRRAGQKAQTLTEYTLILAVISVVGVAVYGTLSSKIILVFSSITTVLDTAQGSH